MTDNYYFGLDGDKMNLIKTYEPNTLDNIILNDKILDSIISFANSWLQGFPDMNKPSILFHGKSGIGKTLTARCLCKDCDFSIIELNASSVRTKEQLKGLLNIPSHDFFGNKNCLFLDEADSMEGGEAIIKKVIMQMKFPVILAANEQFKVPKVLRDICEAIQFYRPSVKALKQHLLRINRDEGLCLTDDILTAASETQDYRAAYNILEARQILKQKEKKISVSDITKSLLYNEPTKIPESGSESDRKQRSAILYHLDENAPKLYDILDSQEMFEIAIKSDIYNRRNQIKFANSILKEIPKTTHEIEEIKYPIYYQKGKNKQESN